MELAEKTLPPVFVDVTGRRRDRIRRIAYGVGGACLAYTALLGVSLAGGPVSPYALLPFPELVERLPAAPVTQNRDRPVVTIAAPPGIPRIRLRTVSGGVGGGAALPDPTNPAAPGATAPPVGPPVESTPDPVPTELPVDPTPEPDPLPEDPPVTPTPEPEPTTEPPAEPPAAPEPPPLPVPETAPGDGGPIADTAPQEPAAPPEPAAPQEPAAAQERAVPQEPTPQQEPEPQPAPTADPSPTATAG